MVRRGYLDATSNHQLGQDGTKDVPWLRWLRDHFGSERYILVTYDNKMAIEHEAVIRECGTTLAVIDSQKRGRQGDALAEDEYTSEVIHRHAHRFVEQPPGTRFKYRCSPTRTPAMTDKKQDATDNLEPDEPTQETEKGLKIGIPDRDDFFAGLEKASEPEADGSNPDPSI